MEESSDLQVVGGDYLKLSSVDAGYCGVTSLKADSLLSSVGYNDLEHIKLPLWLLFCHQFVGFVPAVLEITIVVALALRQYGLAALVFAVLLCCAWFGYRSHLIAFDCMVSAIIIMAYLPLHDAGSPRL